MFASAPDPRRRAQGVLSELRHVDGWSAREQREIEALDLWLPMRRRWPTWSPAVGPFWRGSPNS